ncbi:MAG: rhomboid family intramembrane serine protease [Persephonella sp.]|nr:MAG: rhomboid family intramembrane serine protease [Persephonella sp.]
MIPIKDDIPTRETPVLTIAFIVINTIVFMYELTLSDIEFIHFVYKYGLLPTDIFSLRFDKVITSMFIHGDFSHLFGNMLFLWIFGNNVEDALGKIKFLLFYFLSGLTAGFLQSSISLMFGSADIPMIGASGAISGILAGYVKLYPQARVITIILPFIFMPFILPAWFFIGYWFFIQLVFAIAVPPTVGGVAWYAHIGGFIAGWILINKLYSEKNLKLVFHVEKRF